MKLLVTGGYGFIGSNFLHYLLEEHEDVEIVNLDRLSTGSNLRNLDSIDERRCRFIKGDIADPVAVNKAISGVDAVVNLAAETHVDRSISNPFPFLESNVKGVLVMLEALRNKSGVRLVQVSTDEVYGDISAGSFQEDDPLRPSSPYAASKAAGDMLCLAYHRTHGADVVITRCTNNFGPFQFPEKLIPKSIIRALLGLKIPVYGSGKNVRDWIYVRDHCEALDLALRRGRAGEIYNIAGGNEFNNLELIGRILEILGRPIELVEMVEDRPGHDTRYSLDLEKIKRELGWAPRFDFREALSETVSWYTKSESWWRPLAGESVIAKSPWKVKW